MSFHSLSRFLIDEQSQKHALASDLRVLGEAVARRHAG